MGRQLRNKSTGELLWQHDDGVIVPIEEPGLLAQAGRSFASIGSGIKAAYGELTDQPALVNAARRESMARNRAFAGADSEYPFQSMVGRAIPSLATAPITGGTSVLGQLGTNAVIGAAESALDIDQGGSFAGRGVAGAAGGILGDVGGRLAGRVVNGIRGLANDIRLGRGTADNPAAQEAEEMGLELLGSQRATPGSPEQLTLQRLEQGAESSMFSPGLQRSAKETNDRVMRDSVLRAVGLDAGDFDDLGPATLMEANRRLSDGFTEVASQAASVGPIDIGTELAERLAATRGQIPELIKRGRFKGLEWGILSGNEWNIARRALAQDAAERAAKGQAELADEIFADVEELDRIIEPMLGPEALADFARLREQYRNFKIINKSGNIKPDGQVSTKNLNRALQAGTGYGNTARQGLETVNPESKELIDVARVASNPDFQPFRSSGTAENLSAQRVAGMALDPTEWLSLGGEMAAPMLTGITSRGGNRAVTGAMTPNIPLRAAGAQTGRGALDELFYPFVGSNDDRRQE